MIKKRYLLMLLPAVSVIIFADEPTGNLDYVNGEKVMNIFGEIA